MNTIAEKPTTRLEPAELHRLADAAGRRIAPLWPLDSFVAVNPYLGLIDQPFARAGRYLGETVGEHLFMDRAWFAEQIAQGRIGDDDLNAATRQLGCDWDAAFLKARLDQRPTTTHLPLLVELLDRPDAPPVSEFVVEQISSFLAMHFDRGQALWRPADAEESLFTAWHAYTRIDRSAAAAGLGAVRDALATVPTDADAALVWAVEQLGLADTVLPDFLFAALKSIGGWASFCRYRVWQAELQGAQCADLTDLLAIRLVWEALVLQTRAGAQCRRQWQQSVALWQQQAATTDTTAAEIDETLLTAAEIAFRRQVIDGIATSQPAEATPAQRPAVQAAFCIDVRSEVFRRHLEASLPGVQTIGFAGFFGVPLAYQRLGDQTSRTHTPVLLNPGCQVHDQGDAALAERRLGRLGVSAAWKQFKLSAASCFTFVESAGLSYLPRLVADTLGWHSPSAPPDQAGLTEQERRQVHPALDPALSEAARIDLAENMLRGLGLTGTLAPVVLLAGHGSSTTNNPHRAGLDCGACAGQTGEVSARVAADLLNQPTIRAGLAERGLTIPADTRFVAALHDTTTDHVALLDSDDVAAATAQRLDELRTALAQAGELTRLERLVTLDADARDGEAAERHAVHRGKDWSQVRPEWGLAGNAAFIAAPRWRTRGLDLGGRAFLHDYDWHNDDEYGVLSLIMTAPLIVASWINLQYYGSTVDNERQGSGNKVLHNVVGGLVGVLEGNGGDLRVGLSLQSLHDGKTWRHEPLRLSAFIEAPTEAMEQIIAGNDTLRQLVDNRWITLLQIGEDGRVYRRQAANDWVLETAAR